MITIATTTIRPADEYTRPYRFVLRWDRFNSHPYIVHMETESTSGAPAYHCGDYFTGSLEAFKRLKARAAGAGLEVLLDGAVVK